MAKVNDGYFKAREKAALLGAVGIILIGTIASLYFYLQNQRLKKELFEPVTRTQDFKGIFIEEVSKLIAVPPDEEPTMIRINDVTRAKTQPFFFNAKDGDIVLLYKKAKRAILYDPEAKRIIQAGPLVEASISATVSPTGGN